jgi:hypothetical protein
MQRWYELISIAETLCLNDDEDSVIWKFESKGVYSVSSMYAIVNFRGVMPVHIPAVWRVKVQPRVHVFLWLLANNKLLTRDNLSKRQHVPANFAYGPLDRVPTTRYYSLLPPHVYAGNP